MTIVAGNDPRILTVEVTDELISAHLADGRTISVPLAWSWRLSNATPDQRQHFEIIGTGQGVHWPDIDEDISALGMLTGTPALRHQSKQLHSKKPQCITAFANGQGERAVAQNSSRSRARRPKTMGSQVVTRHNPAMAP